MSAMRTPSPCDDHELDVPLRAAGVVELLGDPGQLLDAVLGQRGPGRLPGRDGYGPGPTLPGDEAMLLGDGTPLEHASVCGEPHQILGGHAVMDRRAEPERGARDPHGDQARLGAGPGLLDATRPVQRIAGQHDTARTHPRQRLEEHRHLELADPLRAQVAEPVLMHHRCPDLAHGVLELLRPADPHADGREPGGRRDAVVCETRAGAQREAPLGHGLDLVPEREELVAE